MPLFNVATYVYKYMETCDIAVNNNWHKELLKVIFKILSIFANLIIL